MAPRRGGGGGGGVEIISGGTRGSLAPPPLKRMQPWHQDGSGQCDIIAGGVDGSGVFKGIYVSGVHLAALLRTFQLSKVFLPVETSTPVAALGQSLQDGIPLVIITRGCFGRELDYGSGPARNKIQQAVWDAARKMRADMPQVLVTCIDIPNNLGQEVIQGCLEPPLNEYRELMYHDGTWYTPSVHNASSLAKWMADNERMDTSKKSGVTFARKKFEWVTTQYGNTWTLSWTPVLEVRPPAPVPQRTDLVFTDSAPKPVSDKSTLPKPGLSSAECSFQKALSQAKESGDSLEMLAAVSSYVPRATANEKASVEEALQVLRELSQSLKSSGNTDEAFRAELLVVRAKLALKEVEEALKVVGTIRASASSPSHKVEALREELRCHMHVGELDKALEAAKEAQTSIQALGDHQANSEVWSLLAEVLQAKGQQAEAAAARGESVREKHH